MHLHPRPRAVLLLLRPFRAASSTTTFTIFTTTTRTSLALFAPAASATWLTTATTGLANGLRHLATSRISVNNTHTRDLAMSQQHYHDTDEHSAHSDEYTALQKYISTYRDPKAAGQEEAAEGQDEKKKKKSWQVSSPIPSFPRRISTRRMLTTRAPVLEEQQEGRG